tara:strand:- start:1485 stop:1763 length:279 start_codon:yes stop_codon:yes gene_type:complete
MRKDHNLTWSRTAHNGSHWIPIAPIHTQNDRVARSQASDYAKYGDRPSSDYFGHYATCTTSGEVIGSVVNGSKKLRSTKPTTWLYLDPRKAK